MLVERDALFLFCSGLAGTTSMVLNGSQLGDDLA